MTEKQNELFDFAMQYLRKNDLIFGYLATLPMKKNDAYRYAFSWTVIRYIDEIIDSSRNLSEKRQTLDKFNNLIDLITNGLIEKSEMGDKFEECLYEYLEMDDASDVKTLSFFQNVLKSFDIDITRTEKVLSWKEYDKYLFYRSDSVLELYYSLFFNESSKKISEYAKDYARSFQYVDDVCDYYKDFSIGQINITEDEVKKLEIKDVNLKDNLEAKNFAKYRKELVLKHYFRFIENVDKSLYSFHIKRYLKESIGYNIYPIIVNKFKPGKEIKLPFKSLILFLTSLKKQSKMFPFFHYFMYLYCLVPWYSYSPKKAEKQRKIA